MADEISMTMSLTARKGGIDLFRSVSGQLADMAGDAWSGGVQSIPTTAGGTQVDLSAAVGTPGVAWFVNLDDTNYVALGRQVGGTFYPFAKLLPGEKFAIRLGLNNDQLYALANTAAVLLEHVILEQ